MRMNKTYLTARFNRVAKAMGWNIEGPAWTREDSIHSVAKVGFVSLERNQYYGWSVSQIVNNAGGHRRLIESCKAAELDAVFTGILLAKNS